MMDAAETYCAFPPTCTLLKTVVGFGSFWWLESCSRTMTSFKACLACLGTFS